MVQGTRELPVVSSRLALEEHSQHRLGLRL